VSLPPHLSGAMISAMADSEVADHDRARVLAHLSRCAGCLARLDAEHATKDAVSALSVGVPRVPGALQGTLLALGSSGLPGGSDTGVGVHHGSVGLPRQRTGMRPGAVGVFSVLGLGLGIAAAAVLPSGPAPASTIPVRPIGPPASALPAGVAPSDSAGAVAVLPAALTLPPPAAQTHPYDADHPCDASHTRGAAQSRAGPSGDGAGLTGSGPAAGTTGESDLRPLRHNRRSRSRRVTPIGAWVTPAAGSPMSR